jgi:hypothetical protein
MGLTHLASGKPRPAQAFRVVLLVGAHHVLVARHVGGEHGGKPALYVVPFHPDSPIGSP